MLFARRCPLCGALAPGPCGPCRRELDLAPVAIVVPGAASAVAAFAYDGAVRDLVLALKYANRRDSVPFLAAALQATLDVAGSDQLLAWIPTTAERRQARGFDQAEVLARALARQLGLPLRSLLRRSGGPPQTGRSAIERAAGPHFAAHLPRRRPVSSVVVIDDVITSGATAAAAVAALRAAGAGSVHLRAVAATPRRGGATPW